MRARGLAGAAALALSLSAATATAVVIQQGNLRIAVQSLSEGREPRVVDRSLHARLN